MIPKIKALAIDDQQPHLDGIVNAIAKLGIGCLPLLHPRDTQQLPTEHFESVRLVFSDLYLGAAEAFSDPNSQHKQVAALLFNLSLKPNTPYALILWTSHAEERDEVAKLLSDPKRFPADRKPLVVVALNKNDYGVGVPGSAVNEMKLWADLKSAIQTSRALNSLLLWERDVLLSVDSASRKIVEIARENAGQQIDLDVEIDRLLSRIAICATSDEFAKIQPRVAVHEGLSSLLLDELQHLPEDAAVNAAWLSSLTEVSKQVKHPLSENQLASLNDALLVSRTPSTGAMRGSVLPTWLTIEEHKARFGVGLEEMWKVLGFSTEPAANSVKWFFIQIEGTCDAEQAKPGVVPFVLAAEVQSNTALKKKGQGRPDSVQESPVFSSEGHSKKLVIGLRFFLTMERDEARQKQASYRLREPLVNWIATSWATYITRPGYVAIT